MKIKSNQIIYYASYSYANDKKFNLVLIVPHACVYAYISSSSATVTTRHQYYCHCSFRSLNVQSKQAVERASKTWIAIRKRWKWQRSLTTLKEAGERKKATLALTHTHHSNSCGFESKYTVCIILLSILIHLFTNTIQNIVIHVIHLSTQTFRFASLSRRLFFPDASLNFIFFPHLLLIFWFGTLTLTANNTFQITW